MDDSRQEDDDVSIEAPELPPLRPSPIHWPKSIRTDETPSQWTTRIGIVDNGPR